MASRRGFIQRLLTAVTAVATGLFSATRGAEAVAVPRIRMMAGTVLTCPKCGAEMCRARRDIMGSDTVNSRDFEGIEYTPLYGGSPVCPHDGAAFIQVSSGGMIYGHRAHTAKGWI